MGTLGKKIPPSTKRKIPSRLPHFKLPGYVPTEGLVGCWLPFVGEGDTLKDYSGEGNDGTLNGPTWIYDSHFGWVLDFDGVDDYVEVSGLQTVSPAHLTYSAWIKTLDSGTNSIYYKEEGGPWHHLTIGTVNPGDIRFTATDSSTTVDLDTSANLDDGNWHHVVGTYDGSTMRVYIDGEEVNSDSTLSGDLSYAEDDIPTIGSRMGSTNFFNGTIDEVRIYDRALSENEISRHFEKTRVLYGV